MTYFIPLKADWLISSHCYLFSPTNYFFGMQHIFSLPGWPWRHACIWKNLRVSHFGLLFTSCPWPEWITNKYVFRSWHKQRTHLNNGYVSIIWILDKFVIQVPLALSKNLLKISNVIIKMALTEWVLSTKDRQDYFLTSDFLSNKTWVKEIRCSNKFKMERV